MKNIIIIGPPGVGKGTMSKQLSEYLGLIHFSTGDLIRKHQKDKTKIGILADKMIDGGHFLPDNIVNEMVKQEIIDNTKSPGFIFDGFPRNVEQAKILDQFLNKIKTPILKVIYLDADKYIVKNRIINRGKESGRKDDTAGVFDVRWDEYKKQTIPVISYFEGRGKVSKVNSDQAIKRVYSEVKNIIDGLD